MISHVTSLTLHKSLVAPRYLHMFQNQTENGWAELQQILDTDERVTIR